MVPYKIDGFRPRVFELSDPRGPNNVMDGWVRFILDLNGKKQIIEVHARLVLESNMFDRDIEVYAPALPSGFSIRADELQKAVRGYLFGFLNTDEAVAECSDSGTFS